MLIQTGMRIGECVELCIEDISFGYRSGSVRIRAGKGNKARTIPLNRSARKALAEYLAPIWNVEPTIDAVTTVWPSRVQGATPTPLWMSRKHNRLSNPAMRRMVAELVAACARRQLVPEQTSAHTFRHTFAIHYLQNHPGDVFGLALLLGHSSLETTRLYSQPTREQLATRVDLISLNAYGD
jgi:site-specific recombinase XerD